MHRINVKSFILWFTTPLFWPTLSFTFLHLFSISSSSFRFFWFYLRPFFFYIFIWPLAAMIRFILTVFRTFAISNPKPLADILHIVLSSTEVT